MKKTIKLDKDKAIQLYNNSTDDGFKEMLENSFGKNFWKPDDITIQICDITSLTLKLGFSPLVYQKPVTTLEKSINALSVLKHVAELYNNGIILDWKNTSIYKYLPYKYYSNNNGCSVFISGYWHFSLDTPACLYYKESKLSKASYNNFKQYWEDYWGI